MAVGGNNSTHQQTNSAGASQSQSTGYTQSAAPGFDPSSGRSMYTGSFGMSLALRMATPLPESIKVFLDTTVEQLSKEFKEYDLQLQDFSSISSCVRGISVSDGRGARHHVLLAFANLLTNDSLSAGEPISNKLVQVFRNFDNQNNKTSAALVVTQEDVENKAETLRMTIRNALIKAVNPEEDEYDVHRITGMSAIFDVRSSNLDEVKNFIQASDPSSVLPRMDMGCLVSLRVDPQKVDQLDPSTKEIVKNMGLDRGNSCVYMAVCAMVDWVGPEPRQNQNGSIPYSQNDLWVIRPVIRITGIYSKMDLATDTLLALVIAQDVFINCALWEQVAKNPSQNPAYLYVDREDPAKRNQTPFDQLVRDCPAIIEEPVLCVDVAVGRKTNNFLYNFTNPQAHQRIVKSAARLLNDTNNYIESAFHQSGPTWSGVASEVGTELLGVVNHRGFLQDSRVFTRLKAFHDGAGQQDWQTTDGLIPYRADPLPRAQAISMIAGSGAYRPFYLSKIIVLKQEFLRAMSLAFQNSGMKINDLDNLQRKHAMGTVYNDVFNGFGYQGGGASIFTNPYYQSYGQQPSWCAPAGSW